MAAAMKIIVQELLTAQPDITVLGLANTAIEDHILRNGCTFEENAAHRSIEKIVANPAAQAKELSYDDLIALGDALEGMETNCPHKN